MQNWKTISKNTIFRRLVLTFLLIILPIYLVGINIYNWGFNAISDGITKSMIAQVSFYLEKLELDIQRIEILQRDVTLDENLTDLVYISNLMSKYDKTKAVISLGYRLSAIKNSSNYIKDVKVIIPTLSFTISAANGVSFYEKKNQDILNAPALSPHSQIVYWQDDFYLTSYYHSTYLNKVLYWLEIPLNKGTFTKELGQFNTFKDSVSMLYCPSNDLFLINGASDGNEEFQNALKQQLNNMKSGTFRVDYNRTRYYGYFFTSDYLGLTIARFVPESMVLSPVKSYQIWLWLFLAMSFVIIVLFAVSTYSFIHKPLNILVNSFDKVESGDLSIKIEHRHNDEFKHLYHSFNKMVDNLETLIDQAYKQKLLMQNAELKQLQAQINPHFLYNSFFILYSIAKAGDHDTVLSFLQQLGSYFKYITRSAEDEVRLHMEVEHARIYANIQALRFSNRVTIQFDEIPDRFRDLVVPRLIIQPIIENSFKYGLEEKASKGELYVRFAESGGYLDITIEDNGNGMNKKELLSMREALSSKQQSAEVTGILNIHKRLQLKFGDNSGLLITNSGIGGLQVSIHIELPGGSHV